MDSLHVNTQQQGWTAFLFFWVLLVASQLFLWAILGAEFLTSSCELRDVRCFSVSCSYA